MRSVSRSRRSTRRSSKRSTPRARTSSCRCGCPKCSAVKWTSTPIFSAATQAEVLFDRATRAGEFVGYGDIKAAVLTLGTPPV